MNKTGSHIEKDIFLKVCDKSLPSAKKPLKKIIKGDAYRTGTRPFDSNKEDIVVGFLTGIEGQYQEGYINITAYVSDISHGDKKKVKDVARCEKIEGYLREFVSLLNPDSEYLFSLANTIQTLPVPDISQHAVYAKLQYKRINF